MFYTKKWNLNSKRKIRIAPTSPIKEYRVSSCYKHETENTFLIRRRERYHLRGESTFAITSLTDRLRVEPWKIIGLRRKNCSAALPRQPVIAPKASLSRLRVHAHVARLHRDVSRKRTLIRTIRAARSYLRQFVFLTAGNPCTFS